MKLAEFENADLVELEEAFDFSASYKIAEPEIFTAEALGEAGASIMQILLISEAKAFLVTGTFIAGAGGENGMEVMHITIDSAGRVTRYNEALEVTPLKVTAEKTLMIEDRNVLRVVTEVPSTQKQQENAAEAFIEKILAALAEPSA